LHFDDLVADRRGRARAILEIAGGREVIGMRMGVEDPLDGQPLALDMRQQSVGRARRGGA
jgi:hypothetical protein